MWTFNLYWLMRGSDAFYKNIQVFQLSPPEVRIFILTISITCHFNILTQWCKIEWDSYSIYIPNFSQIHQCVVVEQPEFIMLNKIFGWDLFQLMGVIIEEQLVFFISVAIVSHIRMHVQIFKNSSYNYCISYDQRGHAKEKLVFGSNQNDTFIIYCVPLIIIRDNFKLHCW